MNKTGKKRNGTQQYSDNREHSPQPDINYGKQSFLIPQSQAAKHGKQNPYSHTSPQITRSMKVSPFKPSATNNDEEAFLQREAERVKLEELKQMTKGIRVWDKPTANSRSPLRRVKDSDIPPAEMSDSQVFYNYNSSQRGYISAAMNIAKSRLTFSLEPLVLPGGKTKQDMSDFINQKKEMFLVELSQKVIQERIEELDYKNKRKSKALKDSEIQLQSDDVKLLKFIEKDQLQTHDKEKDADRIMVERKTMEMIEKDLHLQIVNIRSDIEKQKDVVQGYRELGDFLLGLSPPAWVQEVKQERLKQMELFKKHWIREHRDDTRDDHIIFRGDDPIVFSTLANSKQLTPHTASNLQHQNTLSQDGQEIQQAIKQPKLKKGGVLQIKWILQQYFMLLLFERNINVEDNFCPSIFELS